MAQLSGWMGQANKLQPPSLYCPYIGYKLPLLIKFHA
ncbi:uncharacterized protein G2W53_002846 [Senna tora]|uniref:Uncharacterized protein n=1 Tax=Senna tora TaxID=362788 RepID=A0A834X7Z1_9FABA|nr:uncharacterized protein G2W53_002846 [Senna tora]